MDKRWFGPKSGSGKGRFAWVLGATPISAEGWIATGVFVAVIATSFVPLLTFWPAWALRAAAFAAFLTVVARTFGPDEY